MPVGGNDLDELAGILAFIFDSPGLIMALGAFFDESIRENQGSEPLSVAGYVFKESSYRSFRRAWRKMLASGPTLTTHFHMTHLYARTFEYAGWSAKDRAKYFSLAVDAVRKHALCGVSVMFSQRDFERLAPEFWAITHGSMYSVACQMSLAATAFWMDDNFNQRIPIAYAFESGHKFWKEADVILKGTGDDEELKRHYRYKTHFSLGKLESYGLQAADMLAWIMTRGEVGFPNNRTMDEFAPVVWDLVRGKSGRYQCFHPDENGLRRFFFEQARSRRPTLWVDHPNPYRRALR